jgi:hypothetical protein
MSTTEDQIMRPTAPTPIVDALESECLRLGLTDHGRAAAMESLARKLEVDFTALVTALGRVGHEADGALAGRWTDPLEMRGVALATIAAIVIVAIEENA